LLADEPFTQLNPAVAPPRLPPNFSNPFNAMLSVQSSPQK
jgi:hypothetical protein